MKTLVTALLCVVLTTGCATSITKEGLLVAVGDSSITDEAVSGGSFSDGFVSMIQSAIAGVLKLTGGFLGGNDHTHEISAAD